LVGQNKICYLARNLPGCDIRSYYDGKHQHPSFVFLLTEILSSLSGEVNLESGIRKKVDIKTPIFDYTLGILCILYSTKGDSNHSS
jgi:hypothetical protein